MIVRIRDKKGTKVYTCNDVSIEQENGDRYKVVLDRGKDKFNVYRPLDGTIYNDNGQEIENFHEKKNI